MRSNVFLGILLTTICFIYAQASCAFTQDCTVIPIGEGEDPLLICDPPRPIIDGNASIYNHSYGLVCPEYEGQDVCCNDAQNTLQGENFKILVASFGSSGGGCDVCAANLQRFWCQYTCSPNQADFVDVGELGIFTNPLTKSTVEARAMTFWVDADTACAIYQSCSKTSFVSELSQTSTSAGFFIFLGENGVSTSKVWFTFSFPTGNSTALNFDPHSCAQKFYINDTSGFPIPQNCTCNTCSDLCVGEAGIEVGNILDGFNGSIVLWTYVGLVILGALSVAYHSYKKSIKRKSKIDANEDLSINQGLTS